MFGASERSIRTTRIPVSVINAWEDSLEKRQYDTIFKGRNGLNDIFACYSVQMYCLRLASPYKEVSYLMPLVRHVEE